MNRVLILNILLEEDKRKSFDRRMNQVFAQRDIFYEIIYIVDLFDFKRFKDYTHLLISGSEGSVYQEKDWYSELQRIILQFYKLKKSILGICFAHQFLARVFMGRGNVRRSETPELGWTRIKLEENALFKGLKNFKSAVFHHDEVYGLDERFEVIAGSDRCRIHGFQFNSLPVWGVQFHPDFIYEDVFKFVSKEKSEGFNPDSSYVDCPVDLLEFRENDKIFLNWLEIENSLGNFTSS